MNNTIEKISIEFFAGEHILSCIEDAVGIATIANAQVEFEFNGIDILVKPNSSPTKIHNIFIEKIWERNNA